MVTLNLKPTGVVAVLKDNVKGSIQIELAGKQFAIGHFLIAGADSRRSISIIKKVRCFTLSNFFTQHLFLLLVSFLTI